VASLRDVDIVITRPRAQALKWKEALHELGVGTHLLSVLEIAPVSDSQQLEAVKARILALAEYAKVIFVSQNAVQHAMEWIDRYWPQLPVGVHYFAVGEATAAAARGWGLQVVAAEEAMNSEALLALPALQTVKNEKVLICRGLGGRSHLGEQLRERGAQVDYCELYERRLPAAASAELGRLIPQLRTARDAGRRTVIAVHSGESLQNLSRLLDQQPEARAEVQSNGAVLLVPGERVAELARSLGFRRILVAANATDEAMTRALAEGL
jgi:uroporphyrinogen-III synthase